MADSLIKNLSNTTALTGAPAALDLLLLEQYISGGDLTVPSNNTFASKNITVRDFLAALGLSGANKIINGNMQIDQRNAGASFTPTAGQYSIDRYSCGLAVAGKYSTQQNSGGVTPPTGFTNYLGVVSLSSYSVGAAEYFFQRQHIEGVNCADLNWGTARARPITISFWVRSSLTGTFGGSCLNNLQDRSYPFSYSIIAANTWEFKTVTLLGDTTGTWGTGNGVGIQIVLGLGVGTTLSGPAGAWAAATYLSVTGAVSVVGTNAATFYFTGLKVEAGSVATPFIPDIFSVSLAKCQRYFCKTFDLNVAPVQNSGSAAGALSGVAFQTGTLACGSTWTFPVRMRSTPSVAAYSPNTNSNNWQDTTSGAAFGTTINLTSENGSFIGCQGSSAIGHEMVVNASADAEL